MARSWIPKNLSDEERIAFIEKHRARRLKYYYEHRDEINAKRAGYMKRYYQENKDKWEKTEEKKERRNRLRREKYANDPEYRSRILSQVKQHRIDNPHVKMNERFRTYGITKEQFDKLFESQCGKCAICGYSTIGDHKFFPMIDHCHETGKVRGILCANCNQALGKFKDDIERLKSAIEYLERSNK